MSNSAIGFDMHHFLYVDFTNLTGAPEKLLTHDLDYFIYCNFGKLQSLLIGKEAVKAALASHASKIPPPLTRTRIPTNTRAYRQTHAHAHKSPDISPCFLGAPSPPSYYTIDPWTGLMGLVLAPGTGGAYMT